MSPQHTTGLAVRLFAIWLAVYWARWLAYDFRRAQETEFGVFGFLIVTVLIVVTVLVLWFFPLKIARSILPDFASTTTPSASEGNWLAVGCCLLGLWVVTDAIPALVQNLVVWFWAKREGITITNEWGSGTLYYIVKLALGIWLLLGAAGLRRVFHWARSAGAP